MDFYCLLDNKYAQLTSLYTWPLSQCKRSVQNSFFSRVVEMCAIYKYGNDDALRMNVSFFFLSNSMPFVFSHFQFSPYGALVLNHLALRFYWNWNYVFSHIFLSTFFVVVYFYALIFNCVDIVMTSLLYGMYDILLVFHDLRP